MKGAVRVLRKLEFKTSDSNPIDLIRSHDQGTIHEEEVPANFD